MTDPQEKQIPLEYPILQIMNDQKSPLGAGALAGMLADRGFSISEAGIGRILRGLRHNAFLERVGFQGHRITEQGRNRLKDLEQIRIVGKTLRDFLMQNDMLKEHNVMDILIARRALEREAAAQAAIKATPEDIAELEAIVRAQYEGMERNEDYADLSTAFHRKILQIARCPLLHTLYESIGLSVQCQGFFLVPFKTHNYPLTVSLENTVHAVRAHDQEKAAHFMAPHLGQALPPRQHLFFATGK